MKRVLTEDKAHSYVVVLDAGDEVMGSLASFASEEAIAGGRVWGIGAFEWARLGFFDRESKRYDEHVVDQQVEVLGLHGNLTRFEGQPRVHLHAVLGMADGSARGGHLLEARVWPTLELFVAETRVELVRELDEEAGLPLIRP